MCLHQDILSSMTHTLPSNIILPNKSQSYSIVWTDNTDSIYDLPSLLTYLDNHATKRHRTDTTRSPVTVGITRRVSNGTATPSRESSPPFHPHLLSHNFLSLLVMLLILHQDFLRTFTLVRVTSSTCLLGQVRSTHRLFELRDFRITRVTTKGEGIQQFPGSMHLVLDLADKCLRDSLDVHILDVVEQFLPVLFMSCSRRDRVRQIVSNVKRFQRGEWKGLWETSSAFWTTRN